MTTEYATADDLTADDLGDGEDLTLPSGKKVRLRGLSRQELIRHGRNPDGSVAAPDVIEARNIAACLVAPKLTVPQVQKWQARASANGDFRVLSEAIRDRSGLGKGAQKSDLAEAGD